MRKPEIYSWWVAETEFIERESRKAYPMGQFNAYCVMQARFAIADGFPELASRIIAAKLIGENRGIR